MAVGGADAQIDALLTGGQADAPSWRAAEAEELSAALLWALAVADVGADVSDAWAADPAPPPPPCPPHHWLIGDHADHTLLALRCVRCGAERAQPRDPEPAWRARAAERLSRVPTPSFG